MRVFTVHTPPAENASAAEPMPLLLAEGFCWAALLFGPLWLLAHRLWWPAAAFFVAAVAYGAGRGGMGRSGWAMAGGISGELEVTMCVCAFMCGGGGGGGVSGGV